MDSTGWGRPAGLGGAPLFAGKNSKSITVLYYGEDEEEG